jgi:glutamate/tyrosine decarboxylase-like PLP-dependent enzyme
MSEHRAALESAFEHARRYLAGLGDRPVRWQASLDDLRAALGGPLPEDGIDPARVVDDLARAADPGLVASAGPRFFGFVVGGSLARGARCRLARQHVGPGRGSLRPRSRGAVVEEVAAAWLLDLLGCPGAAASASSPAARWRTSRASSRPATPSSSGPAGTSRRRASPGLRPCGSWSGRTPHVTILTAFRMLGLGSRDVTRVEADDEGRMRPEALRGCRRVG